MALRFWSSHCRYDDWIGCFCDAHTPRTIADSGGCVRNLDSYGIRR